jgi:hypothetical protein
LPERNVSLEEDLLSGVPGILRVADYTIGSQKHTPPIAVVKHCEGVILPLATAPDKVLIG